LAGVSGTVGRRQALLREYYGDVVDIVIAVKAVKYILGASFSIVPVRTSSRVSPNGEAENGSPL